MTTGSPPGLQSERTALAWTRTALAMLVTGAFLARVGAANSDVLAAASGAVLQYRTLGGTGIKVSP